MKTRTFELLVGDSTVLATVSDSTAEGNVSALDQTKVAALEIFDAIGDLAGCFQGLKTKSGANEVTVSFKLGFSAKTGRVLMLLAEAGGEGAVEVTLKWNEG
jgi:Trypsin-co-occurring domain 1